MNYRQLGRSSIMVSEVGLGCEHLQGMDAGSVQAVIAQALASGINFMDVYEQCMGIQELIERVPRTILYQISAKSFPDELRTFIASDDEVGVMTQKEFKSVKELYKEGGMEAVLRTKKGVIDERYKAQQVRQILSMFKRASSSVNELNTLIRAKITTESSANPLMDKLMPDEAEIINGLMTTLDESCDKMSGAIIEADNLLKVMNERIHDWVQFTDR